MKEENRRGRRRRSRRRRGGRKTMKYLQRFLSLLSNSIGGFEESKLPRKGQGGGGRGVSGFDPRVQSDKIIVSPLRLHSKEETYQSKEKEENEEAEEMKRQRK